MNVARIGPAGTHAPAVQVLRVEFAERPVTFRMPFRFGAATLRAAPQVFVRVTIQIDGRQEAGFSAELLSPKWFDKNPALSNEDNFHQLRSALRIAASLYIGAGESPSAFSLHALGAAALYRRCAEEGSGGLIASYGAALLDRAILDAICRSANLSFYDAMRRNLPGMDTTTTPDLHGTDLAEFLATRTAPGSLAVRHTVGMIDPILSTAITEPLDDGLPQSLDTIIEHYGVRYFKIKVGADIDAAINRLQIIASLLDTQAGYYRVSLDGNELFSDADEVGRLFDAIEAEPTLQRLWRATLYIEQPIARDRAIEEPVHAIAKRKPLAIDESDSHIGIFPVARALGYTGMSSKSCKGVYRSILNAARVEHWNSQSGTKQWFMTAEDLSTQPGVSVQQDSALAAFIGMEHVERNGHHYVKGFGSTPITEQQRYLQDYPGLYETGQDGAARLRIADGNIDICALDQPGFGVFTPPDWENLDDFGH